MIIRPCYGGLRVGVGDLGTMGTREGADRSAILEPLLAWGVISASPFTFMRRPQPSSDWPESWQRSFYYDEQEVFGGASDHGYALAYQTRANTLLGLVKEAARPGSSVLDIAAAQGNFSLRLAEAGYEVTWNDLRGELADYVRLKHEIGTLHFLEGNVFELAETETYDIVLLAEVIEHVAHPDELLRKVRRLMRPGGALVLSTPNGRYFRNRLPRFSDVADPSIYEAHQFAPDADGHIYLLYPDEIRSLGAEADLAVEHFVTFCAPLTAGALGLRRVLPWLPATWVLGAEALSQRTPRWLRHRVHMGSAALLRPR